MQTAVTLLWLFVYVKIHKEFFIKWTKDINETVAYLTFLTRALERNFQVKYYPDVLSKSMYIYSFALKYH